MREHWVVIPGFENYEASNMGNIRNRKTGRILRQMLNTEGGYYRVNIGGGHQYVHRLIALAFFDEDIEGKDVNHIDGDHWNNYLYNLEIVSHRDNIRHAWNSGLAKPSKMNIVTCKWCIYRNSCEFCEGRPDDWFCADGRLR